MRRTFNNLFLTAASIFTACQMPWHKFAALKASDFSILLPALCKMVGIFFSCLLPLVGIAAIALVVFAIAASKPAKNTCRR